MSKKKYLFSIIVALAIGVGVFCAPIPQWNPPSASVVVSSIPLPSSQTKQPPTSVYIPRINKRLPIQASVVHGNTWDLFDTSAAWLSTSAVPGEGNVVLYAHDWITLWANLSLLKPGDTVEVDQYDKKFMYIVTESKAVDSHDVNAIISQENRLTMFTCEGSFDQKRRVVYAKPQS